jgi:hypothetical protein
MKKSLFLFFVILIVLSSCGKQKDYNFIGKIYVYQNGNEKQTVGFSDEKIYFKWDDSLGIDAFETRYSFSTENDSIVTITLTKKPDYFENNKWQIVMKEQGFYTLASGKFYKLIDVTTNKK